MTRKLARDVEEERSLQIFKDTFEMHYRGRKMIGCCKTITPKHPDMTMKAN